VSAPRIHFVRCLCGDRLVRLSRKRARAALGRLRGDAFALFGGTCECGRGIDLYVERQPGSVRVIQPSIASLRAEVEGLRATIAQLQAERARLGAFGHTGAGR
jgi:hypothetical protein